MPAKSKSQQRLMGMAYALKKGDLSLDDISSDYRDKVKELANSMSLEDLKDYAETSHEGLPNEVDENVTPGSIPGMNNVILPGDPGDTSLSSQKPGSGDLSGEDEEDDEDDFNLLSYNAYAKTIK